MKNAWKLHEKRMKNAWKLRMKVVQKELEFIMNNPDKPIPQDSRTRQHRPADKPPTELQSDRNNLEVCVALNSPCTAIDIYVINLG